MTDISQRIDALEAELRRTSAETARLRSDALIAGDDVIYRPPLWSQNSAYSAADDRRLILSGFWPGVVDVADLRVVPRQEGANMSVDVLPGHVVVAGTDYADQGYYLCPLAQRVNVPLPAAPAAGEHRQDYIYARVYEGDGTNPAYWQLECHSARSVPISQDPPLIDVHPASVTMLTVIVPVRFDTVSITRNMMVDFRHLARPASTGQCLLLQQRMGLGLPLDMVTWGPELNVLTPPPGPLDIELRIEGQFAPSPFSPPESICAATIDLVIATPAGLRISTPELAVQAIGTWARVPFSTSFVVTNVEYPYPYTIAGYVRLASNIPGYNQLAFDGGVLTMRVSPSGTALSW